MGNRYRDERGYGGAEVAEDGDGAGGGQQAFDPSRDFARLTPRPQGLSLFDILNSGQLRAAGEAAFLLKDSPAWQFVLALLEEYKRNAAERAMMGDDGSLQFHRGYYSAVSGLLIDLQRVQDNAIYERRMEKERADRKSRGISEDEPRDPRPTGGAAAIFPTSDPLV